MTLNSLSPDAAIPDMNTQLQVNGGHVHRKRPGPFGPAWALLPKDQEPLFVDGDTPAYDALERMIDNNYSQLPVRNREGRIIGVFTWKSFGQRSHDLRGVSKGLRPVELPVKDAMEQARFIDPDVYIDTETDWSDIDYVLVGSPTELHGILCVSDALGRLNDFAEAFVLIYEIEHEVRDLIRDVCNDGKLEAMIASMQLSPNVRRPNGLEEFTFAQYKTLICATANWPIFEPVFDSQRELVDADFGRIAELRNSIFHFRGEITPKDTDRLRRFRDKLRYNRDLFARERAT